MPFYPPKPRKRGYYKKKGKNGMPRYKSARPYAASVLQAAVRRAVTRQVNKNIETKTALITSTDGTEIAHNNFITLTNNLLFTSQGTADPTTNANNCRIGDQINLRGVALKMMIEQNERYSNVTFRLIVVRAARGDTPTRATLFNGLSGNKMLDTFNTERYTILFSKTIKMNGANYGSQFADGAGGAPQPSGYGGASSTFSRATKIVKAWIPGTKFSKSSVITYNNGDTNPKFFDYHVLLYAYSNYTTLQDVWNVGRVSDFISIMYFKDA